MTESTQCLLCRLNNARRQRADRGITYECPACCVYIVDKLFENVGKKNSIPDAFILSGYSRQLDKSDEEPPFFSYQSRIWEASQRQIKGELAHPDLQVHMPVKRLDQLMMILEYIASKAKVLRFGTKVELDPKIEFPICYAQDWKEFHNFIVRLEKDGYIENNGHAHADCVLMTDKGEAELNKWLANRNKTDQNIMSVSEQKIFIVHGHNTGVLESTARLIEKVGLEPTILFEQPAKGRTLIEKFEDHGSEASFAVVLLTADDLGRAKVETKLQPRAQQNVVLELGFFIGKLGRSNVAALQEEGVEIPSDYHGVEYIKIDNGGAWKTSLCKEIKAAGFDIDMNKM